MEGHGRGGVGMGKGGCGGGASGVKGRVKLTVLLLGAIVTSVVLVIGWETSPLSDFLLDPRKHTTRILPRHPEFDDDGQLVHGSSFDFSRFEKRVTIERPKRKPLPDRLLVTREDLRVSSESGSRSKSEGGEILLNETEKTELVKTYLKTRDGLEQGSTSQGDTKSEESAIYAFHGSEIELYETARLENGTEATSSAAESGASEIKSDEWQFSSDELDAAQLDFSEEESPKCDYSVGEWVLDDSRPLYSGRECKLWIASFSCSLNGRPDLSYEKFRWQPSGCDLPKFDGRTFLNMCGLIYNLYLLFYHVENVFQNKVMAFVGDSLGRQQLMSLMCMITGGKNETLIQDVGSEYGFFTPQGQRRPIGIAYRFPEVNVTLIFVWSSTLANVEVLNSTHNALHLDRPVQFLLDSIDQVDVVVLNTGHHWNRGKMVENKFNFYYDGARIREKDPLFLVSNAYNQTVHAVVQWLSQRIAGTQKQAFYRTLSPRHFRNGDWNTGGTCDSSRFEKNVPVEGNAIDPLAERATFGTNVKLLNITSLSLVRGEAHVSKFGGPHVGQDCLHWCMPGVPDTWNEVLLAMLSPPIYRRRLPPHH